MSRRRRRPAPLWARIAALAAAAAVALLLVSLLVRLIAGAFGTARRGGAGERDPQFAEPAEVVTRPPELAGEGDWPRLGEDQSAHWDEGEQTPVDKTAEELAQEAEAAR